MPDALIDPEEFPFTESELCDALALVSDRAWATRESAEHAAGMRRAAVDRAAYVAIMAAWRPDPARTIELPDPEAAVPVLSSRIYLWYRDDAVALLSLGSMELSLRVAAYRADQRARGRSSRVRQAVWRATGLVDVPVPPAVEAQLKAEDEAMDTAWHRQVRKMQRRIEKHRHAPRAFRT